MRRRVQLAAVVVIAALSITGGYILSSYLSASQEAFKLTPTGPLTAYHSSAYSNTAAWSSSWYHNGSLWAAPPLALQGKWYANFDTKVLWYRSDNATFAQPLKISGARLDAVSSPLTNTFSVQYTQYPYQPSSLTFSSEGYWKVTGVVGNLSLTFIIYVYPHSACPSTICSG
jgi:hypothetical protein